jgi:RsiW-degrading membrane proteinase PrsW (M82 family)
MNGVLVLIAALLPVAVLIFYIYRKDRLCPEPAGQLIKAFFFGVASAPLSFCLSVPFGMLGLYPEVSDSVWGAISTSFFGAAIPEELAKLFMLWLLLRKNRYFDEKMDGIVYAVCVSLGFAALENIIYLISNYENYLAVGISRALFSIPGHFAFGVLMGYYYSMVKFYPAAPVRNKVMLVLAPILAHGIFDSILFMIDITPAVTGLLVIVFLFFCHRMWKYANKRINEHLQRDYDNNLND